MPTGPWPPLAPIEDLQAGREMSVKEWLDLPEDSDGELVGGRLVEEEVPDALHESAVVWLITVLKTWLGPNGFVLGSELKTLTRERTGRKPDLTVFLAGRPAPPRRGPIRTPADILVEVVSPSARDERRDRVEKMAEYAAFGVRYYWLLDPALGSFEIFERNTEGNYVKVVGATDGRVDPVPGCPGLVVDLDALWSDLARLAETEDERES
jgi:Uma2 family endonuclease